MSADYWGDAWAIVYMYEALGTYQKWTVRRVGGGGVFRLPSHWCVVCTRQP